MKLSEKHRPSQLDDVVGQPATVVLRGFLAKPYPSCWLLEGPGGVGKTSSAFCMAGALGANERWPGLLYYTGGQFGLEDAKEMIRHLKCSCFCPPRPHWHVALIEELEWLSDQTIRFLKANLEVELGERGIVIATSNTVAPLMAKDMWFLQRFSRVEFSGGDEFYEASRQRLERIWAEETGEVLLPEQWNSWGWTGNNGSRSFSMRSALDRMHMELLKKGAE